MTKERSGTALTMYLLLTALICATPYILMAHQGIRGGGGGYVVALMWGPATAAILTVWRLKLGWSWLGFDWRDPDSAWLSYLLPISYALAAYLVIWITGMGSFAQPENIAPLARQLGWSFTNPAIFVPLYFLFIGATGIIGATAHGLGEEIGWRGFMAPLLHDRFGFTGGALLTGVIWTLWHVPLIIYSDYNSAAPYWFALICFFILVMNLTFIMAWFRLKSGSVWPAAIMHGCHNLFIQRIFTPLTAPKGAITAYAIDEFGFVLPLTSFVAALILWLKRDTAIAAYEARRAQD